MTLSSKISINFCNRMIESLPCLMFIGGLKKILILFFCSGEVGAAVELIYLRFYVTWEVFFNAFPHLRVVGLMTIHQ